MKPWTPEQEQTLRDLYPTSTPIAEICARVGDRTGPAVSRKAELLGVKRGGWTAEQVQVLRDLYETKTLMAEICAKVGGRSAAAVGLRATRLGLSRPVAGWTPEEDAIMREAYPSQTSVLDICKRLRRGEDGVRHRASYLGLSRPSERPAYWATPLELRPGYVRWTPEADAILRDLYATRITSLELVEKVGHPLNAIYKRARLLGLARPKPERKPKPQQAKRLPLAPAIVIKRPKGPAHLPGLPRITAETKFTYAPPPPSLVFRTNTHSL